MAAGYSNHRCCYCGEEQSVRTGDHIFARAFFSEDRRADLPKAPACAKCNGRKSELETYLTAVLPFGGRHVDATADLNATEPRLENNLRLRRTLSEGMKRVDGHLTIPFDSAKLFRYFEFVTLGLLWHHGRRYLPRSYAVVSVAPAEKARDVIAPLLSLRGQIVTRNIGNGTFAYSGKTSPTDAAITIWEFLLMGGVRLAEAPVEDNSTYRVLTFTGPRPVITTIESLFGP